MIDPNELPPPNGCASVIITRYRDERGVEKGYSFARGDNGLVIGAVQNGIAHFGVGNTIMQWVFCTDDFAVQYIKDCCREYLGRGDMDFLRSEGTNLIQAVGRTRM